MNRSKLLGESIPFAVGAPGLIWQALFFYVPLLVLVLLSFGSFSFEYFVPFFAWNYAGVVMRTLALALTTATLCLVISYPVAYWIAFNAGHWKNTLLFFLFIPFWTTYLLHVYAWMFIFERGGALNTVLMSVGLITEPIHFLNTTFAVVVVMVYCNIPFMVLPLYSSLEKFDVRLFEASYDLGATWWQMVWRVIVPLSMPGIRSGFFLVLVIAFGEFAIPELIGGDRLMYVGTVIAHYTVSAKTVSLGAAFTLLTSFILLCVTVVLYGVMRRVARQ